MPNFPHIRRGEKPSPTRTPRYGVAERRRREEKSLVRRLTRRSAERQESREPGFLSRTINNWWGRLISAVLGGSFAEESEQYLAHQTKRDYVCNTLGQAAWGGLFPLLTVVCTWLVGVEQAGLFSMAFVIGTLLLFVGNYGVRTYQVSDLDEMASFTDYQIQRALTCVLMLALGWLWCVLRGYSEPMLSICMGVVGFRAADAFADAFEGRLQQKDKLYLAGLSQAVRCGLAFVVFSIVLVATRNLTYASWGMAIAGIASLLVLTVPLAYFETDRSLPWSAQAVRDLFVQGLPLFIALFAYNLIDSMPKFAMEGSLAYENQLYYNAMYFPAHTILMVAGFIYKPQLVRLARIWEDRESHRRFDLIVLAMLGVIAVITAATALVMGWVGIPLMSLMYGLDFEPFRSLVYVMVATGGVCACVDFLYQIITVLRAQESVSRIYLVALVFSVPVALLLVNFAQLAGAVVGSLVTMAILLLLLGTEYLAIRRRAA